MPLSQLARLELQDNEIGEAGVTAIERAHALQVRSLA